MENESLDTSKEETKEVQQPAAPEESGKQEDWKSPVKSLVNDLLDIAESVIVSVFVVVLVFAFILRPVTVDGSSMNPTLYDKDRVLMVELFYHPQRGDVVIVDSYTAYGKPLVKRVIAKGGDVVNIDYQAGTVSVNGEVLQEAYIAEPTYLGYDVTFPYTVPEGTVFVMGDNRNASLDSRSSYVGCIDERDILGKVLLCFLPFSDFGVVK